MEASRLAADHTAAELQRLNRALRTSSAINRAQHHAADEEALIKEVCRIVVEEAGYRVAFGTRAERDEAKSLRPIAWAGIEREFLDALQLTWADTERGRGPSGHAVRTGMPSVIRDMLTDPRAAVWREDCLARGYASVIALPIPVGGEIFGTLTIYAPEPDAFDAGEVGLLGEAANDLGYGIAALRASARAKEAEETIRRMAYFDALTGLPNRVQLRLQLEQAIEEARQKNRALALLYVEGGRFREINEVLGYREGDLLLQQVAARLVAAAGPAISVARVGEDEFAVLLAGGAEQAKQLAQKIQVVMHEPVELAGVMLDVRTSIGITLYPGHGTTADILMRRASVALYQAKRSGAGYAVYSGVADTDNARRLALMGDLRQAIENDELVLYYQPKIHIASRSLCGAEALVRWNHPRHGMVNPGEFIKLAESAGLITPLTYWVLDAALQQGYALRQRGLKLPLAVNLSARDLHDPRLLDRISGSFATWGASPDSIQFELTESAVMEDPAGSLKILGRLKRLDVELFIDDFGTGYSSLAYLQKLPIDDIKVDQAFVSTMVTNKDSAVIVRSTIDLAHDLDLKVVAEGVENQAVWDRLAGLGCDVAQGYCISAPIPAEQLGDWEARSPWRGSAGGH
jgi:diguanylate cyclase